MSMMGLCCPNERRAVGCVQVEVRRGYTALSTGLEALTGFKDWLWWPDTDQNNELTYPKAK